MQSKKIENVNMSGDLGTIAENTIKKNPQNKCIMLDKSILPSRGKFYNGDIYVKKFTPIDVKNLSMVTEENVNSTINTVLSRCIQGINVNDILLGDKLWFIFYLRSITYNDYPISIKYNCPDCKKVEVKEIRIKDLEINYLSDNFNDQLTLDNGDTITIGFPSIGNEIQSSQMKKADEFAEFDGELLDISLYIKAVNNEKLTIRKAYEYLSNLSAMDFSIFSNVMGENAFGLKPTIDILCTCGNKINKRITFSSDFFLPTFRKH